VTNRHYDVVVLGRSLGSLAAAALLARRDFRVLVLGQGQRPTRYHYDRFTLVRRAFSLLSASSPVMKRLLQELAQSPRFARRTRELDPMFTILMPDRRIEVAPDMELFSREVEREFPEVRQIVDELYATFAQVNSAVDAAFERDAVWPPDGFWERLETGRIASQIPLAGGSAPRDVLGKFPVGHVYRDVVLLPAVFATDLAVPADQLPALATARLHGAWTRGVSAMEQGEDELAEFLIERIEAHGGECRLERSATRILVDRGRVAAVVEDGEEDPTGADSVIADSSGEVVADLARGDGITKRALNDWPRLSATAGRFVVTMAVKRSGLPEALGQESFVLPLSGTRQNPRHPVVHLQRLDAMAEAADESVLAAEMLLSTRGPLTLMEARNAVMTTIFEHFPFLARHLLVVDSPHDGLPLSDYTGGSERRIDRIHLAESSPGAEPMRWQWSVEPPGYLDIAGEPIRGPIPGSFLVGPTVLPGLGQEGQLLSAWSAARIVTRGDRRRQRMRRQMWTKIET
jgi:hypothetical protein